jgi:DNA repair protein RecO (recombination protein O)
MAQQRLYQTEAIILRRADMGEADRLLTIFTPALGKLRVIAKGARKPKSRKSGHVELFMRVKLLLAKGRTMDIVSQAETVEAYLPLREDLLRSTFAHYCAELFDRFTAEQEAQSELYDLLAVTLERLCAASDPALVARYYEIQLLTLVGYQPRLFGCARCGRKLEPVDSDTPPYAFDAELGGALCAACVDERPQAVALSLAALKVLRHAMRTDYATFAALNLRPSLHRELEQVTQKYITYILERNLKSTEFLRTLRLEAAGGARDD